MAVLEECQHDVSEVRLALLLAAQLANFCEDVDTGLSYDPVAVILRFVPVELEQPAEKLSIHQLSDYRKLQYCLLFDLKAYILAK